MARGRFHLLVAFFAIALLVTLVAVVLRRPAAPVHGEPGLDVLLITIDTLRADALSVYGQPRPTSPWIDRLARAGVRFETAHAHNVMTLPSHANILSGRLAFEHGVRDNSGFRFPRRLDTIATLLKAHGYRTAAFVSSFTLDSRFGLERGFDVYEDSFVARQATAVPRIPERAGLETVALARRWLSEPTAAPRFCWLHLYEPHAPYTPPPAQAIAFADQPYLGEVAAADAALGSLVEPLLAAGRRGHTVVLLTADHGEGLGEHGERTHGLFAYESTLRVPLVLFAPRLLRPRVVREPVRHVDVLPTLLDAVGLPIPAGLPGRSLLRLAGGGAAAPAASYFEALSSMLSRGWAPLYGVVDQRLKYIELPLPELYATAADPGEATNLAASRPHELERLRALLARYRALDSGASPTVESSDTRERLAALGYLTTTATFLRRRYTAADDPKRLVQLDDLMQQAVASERAGDLERAIALCEEVLRQRPDMLSGLLLLARLQRSRGRLADAVALVERALAQDPENAPVAALLAGYLGETGRAAEAVRLLEPYAGGADPPSDVLQAQGVALARLGRSREALDAFARASQRDPDDPVLLVRIATVHLQRGEPAPAVTALERALQLDPDLGIAHHHLGLLRLAEGDSVAAERHFRRALALDANDVDSQLNLGLLLAREGRAAEARPLLESFVRSAPRSVYGSRIERVMALLRTNSLAPASGPR